MKSISALSLAGVVSLALSTVVQAAPAKIWTTWQSTTMSQSQCMHRATAAISDLGYDYQVLESGVYGEFEILDISVTIRCTTEMGFIFFIAAHPDTDVASQELNALIDAF
jgi:hypothetical protein